MADKKHYTLNDPFTGKDVQISDDLCDRLRGRYACGPTTASGEPEFGWREFETPPIQHDAAAVIDALKAEIARLRNGIEGYRAGNYPNPRTHRPHPCPHGCNHWQECDACNDAALVAILAAPATTQKPPSPPVVRVPCPSSEE